MHIVVIGGTRFIGPPLVRRLHAAGHRLTLFHRHVAQVDLPEGIEHILGDRHVRLPHLVDQVRRQPPDVVVDMAPLTGEDARQLVTAFRGVAGRVVAISSQDVYRAYGRVNGTEPGDPDPVPLSEDAPLRERLYPYRSETPRTSDDPRRILDDYDKILVERAVMNEPKLPGTILRLPMVYGPGDYQHRLYPWLKRMDDGRPAILLDRLTARWRWTRDYVENTAAAIALAVTDERAAGHVYNVGEIPALTMVEWIEAIARVVGWDGELVLAADYQLPEELRSRAGMEQHLVADATRIRAELGFESPVGQDQALRQTVAWERANPPDLPDTGQFDYATEDAILSRLR